MLSQRALSYLEYHCIVFYIRHREGTVNDEYTESDGSQRPRHLAPSPTEEATLASAHMGAGEGTRMGEGKRAVSDADPDESSGDMAIPASDDEADVLVDLRPPAHARDGQHFSTSSLKECLPDFDALGSTPDEGGEVAQAIIGVQETSGDAATGNDIVGQTGAFKAADVQVPLLSDTAKQRTDERSLWERMPHWVYALVCVIVLAAIGSSVILTGAFGLLTKTELMNVVGMSEEDARSSLEEGGYKVTVREQETQMESDTGRVIATDPPSGSEVAAGSSITIKVGKSSGETKAVPDLSGLLEQDALNAIASSNWFVKDDVAYAYSDTIEKGRVISQGPAAGDQKTKGTKVDLVISEGRSPNSGPTNNDAASASVTVPDIIGMPLEDARTLLQGMGLSVQRGDDVTNLDATPGTVQSVSPGVGTSVKTGETVTIRIMATR